MDIEDGLDQTNGLLADPNLLDSFCKELDKIIPNQHIEKKMMLLSLASGLCCDCPEKLHIFVNADSSAGKSFFIKQFAKLLPNEKTEYYTRISPKALAYLHPEDQEEGWCWDSKHLFVEDIEQELLDSDVFKVFATEGAHTVIVDRGKARVIAINGSPTIIITTAEARPKAEILNRFIMLNLDESEAQTRAIFKAIAAEIEIDHRWMLVFDHLKPQKVAIPWIERIAERFPACKVRARRDFHRFRAMICASAILHQRQRQFDQAGSLVAQQQDFDIAMSLFQFTNPGAFLVDLTHTQKKAYEDLATLARRCPSVSIGVDFTLSDVRPTPSEKTATTCECGSVYLSRACISHHYGNRTVRQWDFLLERLQNKGAVTSRTLINPATKREVTVYAIKIMNTTDTFDLKDNNTTTIDSSSKDGVYVGVGFGENTPESSKIDTDGHPQGETSTIPVPEDAVLEVETVKMIKKP